MSFKEKLEMAKLMTKSKKGTLKSGMIDRAINFFVLLVVLFLLYAELMPTAQNAGNNLSASGVPLGGLFASDGVVFLIIMAGLIVVVVKNVRKTK